MKNTEKTMEKIVTLCKGRGFIFAGSEIYGGLANTWDYGPLGVELKNNVKKAWWKKFVQENPYNVGLDAAILMNPTTWLASGHLGGFSDPLMDCKECKERFRADKVIEDWCAENNFELPKPIDAFSQAEMKDFVEEHNIPCPSCGKHNFTDIRSGEYPTAEQMLDIEGGYTLKSKVVTANINLYYMLYRNQLVQTGELSDTGELLSRNIPKSYRRGVELMVDVKATKWLTLGANATLSQNHILDYVDYIDDMSFERGRTTIAYSPSVIAGAYVEATTKGFSARFSTRYVSKQYLTNGQYEDLILPRYSVSDLNLAYTLGNVRFGVKIGNIFNAKYCASGYGGSWLEGATLADRKSWACYFPQATTSVLGNVTINF